MKNLLLIVAVIFASNLTFSQESLKIVWLEEYEWKVISNQEDDNIHIIDIIPGNEDVDSWTMLGQMMSIKGVVNLPMERAMELMFDQTKASSPRAKLTEIERDEEDAFPWIIFKIESPGFEGDSTLESQLWYIRQGSTSLYVNFIAKKKKRLKRDFVEEWSAVFRASEVIELE